MPQSRSDVDLAGILQICSLFEDSSFLGPQTRRFHNANTWTHPKTNADALHISILFFLLLPSLLRHCTRETRSVMLRDSSMVRRCRTVLAQTHPCCLSPFPEPSVPRRTPWVSRHGTNRCVRTDQGAEQARHREWNDTNVPGVTTTKQPRLTLDDLDDDARSQSGSGARLHTPQHELTQRPSTSTSTSTTRTQSHLIQLSHRREQRGGDERREAEEREWRRGGCCALVSRRCQNRRSNEVNRA